MTLFAKLAAAYAGTLVGLSAIHLATPQRDGPLALSQVFAPHLFLPLAILVPIALRFGGRWERTIVLLALVMGVGRFAGGMVSLPPQATEGAQRIPVLTWNLATGRVSTELLAERILASDAAIVGLQELRPSHAAALEADPELVARFPYRVLEPEWSVLGMGLLSAYPLAESRTSFEPPHILARVALADDRSMTVMTAHPLPPRMGLVGLLPRRYETSQRDRDLRTIRALLTPALESGEAVLVLGDFNVTDREPGYAELSDGLDDAHLAVGLGPGSTWRPDQFDFLPFGILRIDYIFTSGPARATGLATDCITHAGDHCILSGTIELRP